MTAQRKAPMDLGTLAAEHELVHDPAVRHRDADETRGRLLRAALQRFARDGYSATTVRDIATDAGVNFALINRYFVSKAGLFEACLSYTVEELKASSRPGSSIEQILSGIVTQVLDAADGERPLQMLLLLRSTGDAEVDEIRRATLKGFSDRMAQSAGWSVADATSAGLELRTQLVLATAFGILLLRSSTALEPLRSATEDDLREPLGDILAALLTPPIAG